jgi:hypothetical protein
MLDWLLHTLKDVFIEQQRLPPARPCDYCIHLLTNMAPVIVRPDRYPQLQKDELEIQCTAMLE